MRQRQRFTDGGRTDTQAYRHGETYSRAIWGSDVQACQLRAASGHASAEDYATLARYWDRECRRMIAIIHPTTRIVGYCCHTCGVILPHAGASCANGHMNMPACDLQDARDCATENAATFAARTLHYARLATRP